MKIYYLASEFEYDNYCFGDLESAEFTSVEQIYSYFKETFGDDITDDVLRKLPEIISKEVPDYDFYAVQSEVDGFGHDTATLACFKTRVEAELYCNEYSGEVVGQRWGEYNEIWG